MSVILALPSKGRLKEQTEAWLEDCGAPLKVSGGARGYQAALAGVEGVEVRLISASGIAAALAAGEAHLGVTGEDLLAESGGTAAPLLALGFGRADLVVAAPRSWIDVETMSDVDDVAHDILARTGRRLRVATKYAVQTRAFFAAHGVADYRIVDSSGATEGAPASGAAELIVDITTSGATLAANGLKVLADGLILKSQARLAAAPAADWDPAEAAAARDLLGVFEARARGKAAVTLSWPREHDRAAQAVVPGAQSGGAVAPREQVFTLTRALAKAGVGQVVVGEAAYVFDAESPAADRLDALIAKGKS